MSLVLNLSNQKLMQTIYNIHYNIQSFILLTITKLNKKILIF